MKEMKQRQERHFPDSKTLARTTNVSLENQPRCGGKGIFQVSCRKLPVQNIDLEVKLLRLDLKAELGCCLWSSWR